MTAVECPSTAPDLAAAPAAGRALLAILDALVEADEVPIARAASSEDATPLAPTP